MNYVRRPVPWWFWAAIGGAVLLTMMSASQGDDRTYMEPA
jgi:hypothetical protein